MKPDDPEIDPALPTTVTASGRVVYDPLQARRVEVEPSANGDVQKLLGELRALDDQDARDVVPTPVALAPSKDGALVTGPAQEAARAHVEAPVPEPAPQGHIDSAPVKIVDPRRLPTMRIETKGPPPAPIEGAPRTPDLIAEGSVAPSSVAPSSVAPTERPVTNRRAGLVIAAVSLAAVLAFVVTRGRGDGDSGSSGTSIPTTSAASTTSETQPEPTATIASATLSSPDAMGLTTTSQPEQPSTQDPKKATGTATTAPTATPPIVTTATAAKTATPTTSAAPSTTATETPAATTTPSASQTSAPAVSSAPSTKPGGSGPPPSDTTFVIQPKGTTP